MANGSWCYIKVDPFLQQVVSECLLGHCCSIVAAQAGHSLAPTAQYRTSSNRLLQAFLPCDVILLELMNTTQHHLESAKATMLHQKRPFDSKQSVDVPITLNMQFP